MYRQDESRAASTSFSRSLLVRAVWPRRSVHSSLFGCYVQLHTTSDREVAEAGGRDETSPSSPGRCGRQGRRTGEAIAAASG